MDGKILGAGLLVLLVMGSIVGATQTDIDTDVLNAEPEVTSVFPPDGATSVTNNPNISFTVDDPENDTIQVKVKGNELIYNESVEAGSTVNFSTVNHTLGSEFERTYNWVIELDDGSNTVSNSYNFTTLDPFEKTPTQNLSEASMVLDYSGNDIKYSESCPSIGNDTQCVHTHSSFGTGEHLKYDNPLYLTEKSNFNVTFGLDNHFRTYGFNFDDLVSRTYTGHFEFRFHQNGKTQSFKQDYGYYEAHNYKANWNFELTPREEGVVMNLDDGSGSIEVRQTNFTTKEPIYFELYANDRGKKSCFGDACNNFDADDSGSELRLYSWDTDMVQVKEGVDEENLFSMVFSIFGL